MIGGIKNTKQICLHSDDSNKEAGSAEGVLLSEDNSQSDTTAIEDEKRFEIDETQTSDVAVQPLLENDPATTAESQTLEVGTPGDFSSALHEHNVKTELSHPPPSATEDSPDFIAMIDEPLPESLGGSHGAAVQSMFVEEVMRTAQTNVAQQSTAPELPLVDFAPPPDSSFEPTMATAVSSLAVRGAIEEPDSPRVSEFGRNKAPTPLKPDEDATQVIQGSTKIAAPTEKTDLQMGSETKVVDKADLGKTTSAKTPAKKEKASKKNAGAAKKSKATPPEQSNADSQMPQSVVAAPAIDQSKSRKELRIALGVLVTCVFVAAGLIVSKRYLRSVKSTQTSGTENSSAAEVASSPPSPPEPIIDLEKGVLITDAAVKSTTENGVAQTKDAGETAQGPLKPKTLNAKEEEKQASEKKNSETAGDQNNTEVAADETLILTRPNSRYSESRPELRPLVDAAIALDKVQPRKVLSQLKQLPDSFASTSRGERLALREVTARYYLQVGAYAKAIKLFREVCLDPRGVSEMEVCLHAARGAVVTGQFEEAQGLIDILKERSTRETSIWREWVRVLESAQELNRMAVNSFVDFIDEFSEKGPYMTSEWNLQLAAFFARKFVSLKRSEQVEVLRQLDRNRRKTIELRLAPLRYGSDIGSYMLPAFLNIYLRLHELPEIKIDGEDPESESELSLVSWTLYVVTQSEPGELRQTRARLAPLFAERGFAPLARVIEAHLAAQAGDFIGASGLMAEQVSLQPSLQVDLDSKEVKERNAGIEFLKATQRFEQMPFIYVEWLYLGIKVAAGLNDLNFMTTALTALEGILQRYPEIATDFQYWNMLARGYKSLGKLADMRKAVKQAEAVASTRHELGFVTGYKVWLLVKARKIEQAKALMREGMRLYPYHARLLEYGAEFATLWGEDPSYYLKLESEVPRQFQYRGRDRTLLSLFTISKLLNKF